MWFSMKGLCSNVLQEKLKVLIESDDIIDKLLHQNMKHKTNVISMQIPEKSYQYQIDVVISRIIQ